ncbi:MAG: hypothetical protein AAFN27_14890 [Pseudomonadota bacterium]
MGRLTMIAAAGADPSDERSQTLLNALAAMRSSMEILRDTPDITPDQRTMFAGIALTEEARVERLLHELMAERGTQS